MSFASCWQSRADAGFYHMQAAALTLKNEPEAILRMTEFVENFGKNHGLSEWDILAFTLAIEELITNTIDYGYPGVPEGGAEIFLEMKKEGERIYAVLRDSGLPFDPLARPEADLSGSLEDKAIGGLGVHLVKKMMDHVAYENCKGENILSMDRAAGPC